MRFINYVMAAASVAIMLSCEEQLTEEVNDVVTITAENEQIQPDTKTVIDDQSLKISWLAYDAINVFFGASESSKFVTETSGRKAQFKGSVSVITGGGDDLTNDTSLWGVYPYKSTTTCDGTSITYTLPANQEAKENSFADDLFPQIARSQNFFMSFYNLCGSFRFTLSREDIVKVTLSGNNGESLAGKVKATMPLGGVPIVSEVLDGTTTLTMTAPEGECFKTGVNYYFVLYPTVFSKGLTLTFYTVDKKATFNYTGSYTLARNLFVLFDKLDGKLTFEDYEEEVDSQNIIFADAVMKEMCVNAFDTNGDGELSYKEAAAVNDLSQMTLTKKTFKSFDEFQYFTNVKVIPDNYFSSIGIQSIVLPKGLKEIGYQAFSNCIHLRDIKLPESLITIANHSFSHCTSLSNIIIPDSVTSIGNNAFEYCTSLASITIPESVTSISDAFRDCI